MPLKLWGERQLSSMKKDVDKMFESLCVDFGLPPASPLGDAGLCLSRTQTEIIIHTTVPNLSPEDFAVSITGRHLVITGHSAVQAADGTRITRSVRRELYLPCPVDKDKATASYEDGVIEIRVPLCATNNNHHATE